MSKPTGQVSGWRARASGHGPAMYWGGMALLVVLAAIPFVLLSVTAPSAEVDPRVELTKSSRSVAGQSPGPGQTASPAASPSTAASAAPSADPPASPAASTRPARPPASAAATRGDGDFDLQCWPEVTVIPGRTATVDCSVELTNGYDGEIAVACRVAGMECSANPPKIQPVHGQAAMPAKLTVAAPATAPVGTTIAAVTALGGETGAAQRQADVTVNVPPPFSVSCESVGTSFVQGSKAQVKCWVTFFEGFGGDVSLRLVNGGLLDAVLDTTSLAPVPNETRAFVIELDTTGLASRPYALQVNAASDRYREEATALFQVVPAP